MDRDTIVNRMRESVHVRIRDLGLQLRLMRQILQHCLQLYQKKRQQREQQAASAGPGSSAPSGPLQLPPSSVSVPPRVRRFALFTVTPQMPMDSFQGGQQPSTMMPAQHHVSEPMAQPSAGATGSRRFVNLSAINPALSGGPCGQNGSTSGNGNGHPSTHSNTSAAGPPGVSMPPHAPSVYMPMPGAGAPDAVHNGPMNGGMSRPMHGMSMVPQPVSSTTPSTMHPMPGTTTPTGMHPHPMSGGMMQQGPPGYAIATSAPMGMPVMRAPQPPHHHQVPPPQPQPQPAFASDANGSLLQQAHAATSSSGGSGIPGVTATHTPHPAVSGPMVGEPPRSAAAAAHHGQEQRETKHRYTDLCYWMWHAFYCQGQCGKSTCTKMVRLIDHVKQCRREGGKECTVCVAA